MCVGTCICVHSCVCVCIITAHELKSFRQAKIFCSLKQFEVICSQFTNVCVAATAMFEVCVCVRECEYVNCVRVSCVSAPVCKCLPVCILLECNYACE